MEAESSAPGTQLIVPVKRLSIRNSVDITLFDEPPLVRTISSDYIRRLVCVVLMKMQQGRFQVRWYREWKYKCGLPGRNTDLDLELDLRLHDGLYEGSSPWAQAEDKASYPFLSCFCGSAPR